MATQLHLANKVQYLRGITFSQLTHNEKISIKTIGRPTPKLFIEQKSKARNGIYTRHFNDKVYDENDWICGCEEKNAFFCFPCLLFSKDKNPWVTNGVNDLHHLKGKILKHGRSKDHINHVIDYQFLGKGSIGDHMNSAYKQSIAKYNDQVAKNRDALSKIINIIKLCGKFELPLRGHNERASSDNPGVFRGLVDYTCSLDSSLDSHINSSKVFKGTSKTIQNELLDTMLKISRDKIKEEIKNTDYVAVMIDETTDNYDIIQMVIVLRYVLEGKPVERFWGFFNPVSTTGEHLSDVLFRELLPLIGDCPEKLIAQTYDGASALSGIYKGVKTRIQEVYKNAHYIHCYAHQLNLILEKATSQNSNVKVFFSSLSGIPAFFHRSAKRMAVLDDVAGGQRVPSPSATRWSFKEKTVESVHEMKDKLIECCTILEDSNNNETVYKATGIKRMLNDPEFIFWLSFFHQIMPHVGVLYSQFQKQTFDAVWGKTILEDFNVKIQEIRDNCDTLVIVPPEITKRSFNIDNLRVAAREICDVIMMQCQERFSFTKHLEASNLFCIEKFPSYVIEFPIQYLEQAVAAYPSLEREQLKSELSVLYKRGDLVDKKDSLISLLGRLVENNLQSTFENTVKLLKILITTPMTSAEAERCFSTLKRIKTFVRATMMNERLSALAMISSETKMISEMNDFNERVIQHFATSKNRRAEFIFK